MPLLIVMILVALWAQIIAGIYAMLTPFANDLRNIQNYNVAYYGAIASVERSYLVLRWHTAGFEGSGWWIWTDEYWPASDSTGDIIDEKYFWLLARKSNWNWITWEIKNLNAWATIPEAGKWDLDPDVSSWNDYTRLTFDEALQVALYVDESPTDKYYTWVVDSDISKITDTSNLTVRASIRVPLKLLSWFNNWNITSPYLDKNWNIDLDWDGVIDDIIVNRSLFGYTGDTEFTIFPSINITSDNKPASDDTAIRESVINYYTTTTNKYNLCFWWSCSYDANPLVWRSSIPNSNTTIDDIDNFNQSPEDAVKTWFNNIFVNSNTKKLNLKFSLVNLLKYTDTQVYPYLEIKISNDNNKPLPDTYFHITWRGKAWSYDVKIKLKKKVFNVSAASDFTVLF